MSTTTTTNRRKERLKHDKDTLVAAATVILGDTNCVHHNIRPGFVLPTLENINTDTVAGSGES